MVLATDIMMPPRRNSFNGPEPASKSPPKSHWWFLTSKIKPSTSFGGSIHTVAIQKLRESKWFEQDEERLFCAVIESGFIVEIVQKEQSITEYKSHYGVVSVEAKKSEFIIKQTFSYHSAFDCLNKRAFQISVQYLLMFLKKKRKWKHREYFTVTCSSFAQKIKSSNDKLFTIIFFYIYLFWSHRQEAHSERYFRVHSEQAGQPVESDQAQHRRTMEPSLQDQDQ